MRTDFEKLLRTSHQRGGPLGHVFDQQQQLAAVSIPLRVAGHPPSALAGCGYLGPHGLPEFAVLLETIASAIGQIVLLDTLRRLEWEAQSCAAIVELLSTIQSAGSYDAALHATVNELQKFFQCQRINLGVLKKMGIGVELAAVSGLSEFDRSSQTAQRLVAAMDEAPLRGDLTCWPPPPGQTRHALMGHRQLLDATRTEALVSIPLPSGDDQHVRRDCGRRSARRHSHGNSLPPGKRWLLIWPPHWMPGTARSRRDGRAGGRMHSARSRGQIATSLGHYHSRALRRGELPARCRIT